MIATRSLTLITWLGAAAWLVSCTTTTSASHQPIPRKAWKIQDYYPLRVGDRRVYKIQYGNSQKSIQRTIQIIKKEGDRYFDNHQGVYQIDAYGLLGNRLRYLLKYPLRQGQRWLSVTGQTTVERYQIIDTNRTLTVPAGTYSHCIVVRSQQRLGPQGTLEALHFYAPKVGPVKIVTTLTTKGRRLPQWNLELIAYYPAK